MWSIGNLWTHGPNQSTTPMPTSPSSYIMVMPEIHVLLVDHDSESLLSTSQLLELCQYRVTLVEVASSAIHMLSTGKMKIDIIMVNVINSLDLHILELLQLTTNMDIPVIVMSVEEDALMAMSALQSGALLFLKKPVAIEMLKCIWQFIAWQKIRAANERERIIAANHSASGIEIRETINPVEDNPNNAELNTLDMLRINNGKSMQNNYNVKNNSIGGDDYESENHMLSGTTKRKACIEWTHELHQKFMDAVEQLGEGRCFPKEIHELMNVLGLTRMQVSGYLQKCRNHNWRSPNERISTTDIQHPSSEPSDTVTCKVRRFGLMPKLGKWDRSKGSETAGQSEDVIRIDGGRVVNVEIEPRPDNNVVANNDNNDQYVPIIPITIGDMSAHPQAVAIEDITDLNAFVDDLLNLRDVDFLVHNLSTGMTGFVNSSVNIAGSSHNVANSNDDGGDHIEGAYQTNTMGSSTENKRQTSSET